MGRRVKVEVGPGGCACTCKSCDDQRHCHRPERGCRANEVAPKKRKPIKAKRSIRCAEEWNGMRCRLRVKHGGRHQWRNPVERNEHPKACDYPRYSGKVTEDDRIYQTFHKTAKLLGEVEAGLDAYFRLAKQHGLFAAPGDGSASICEVHARQIMEDAGRLTALLSTEAKLVIPILFMLVGDQKAARILGVSVDEERSEETVH